MDELDATPQAQALLRELFQLSVEDEQLPLRALLNLHKGVLRKPLDVLGKSVLDYGNTRRYLDLHYPGAWDGLPSKINPKLKKLHTKACPSEPYLMRQSSGVLAPGVDVMLFRADQQWEGGWFAITLHRFTWEGMQLEPLAQMLELMLQTYPPAHAMLVELASIEL
jgi:hypothetical protein